MSINPIFKILPTRVDNFIGRTNDWQKIVELIHSNRLVTVTGISGIGKSAIVKEVAHFLFKRDFTKDGIIYLSLVDCQTIDNMFQRIIIPIGNSLLSNNMIADIKNKDSEELFTEYIRLIKEKEILIILDNWDLIIKQDNISFVVLVEDFLQKVFKSKLIITWEVPIGQIKDVTEKWYEIKSLQPFDSLELIKSKSAIEVKDTELLELIDDLENRNSRRQTNLTYLDHDLFKIINGHPLALVMVSSLRKEMRLKQIYDLLVLIQEECENEKDFNSKNIAINLSTEASLLFLRGVDKNAYLSLIYFALMPAGLTNESLCKLLGNQWEEYKNLLLSKSLILHRHMLADNNELAIYRIESNLTKVILKRSTPFEIDEWDSHLTNFILAKLSEIYLNSNLTEKSSKYTIISLEGNIWELIKRIKKKVIKEGKKNSPDKPKQMKRNSSESSWSDSDEDESKDEIDPNPALLAPSTRKNTLLRKSTYHLRKEMALNNLNVSHEWSFISDSGKHQFWFL